MDTKFTAEQRDLAVGIPENELDLHPFCNVCGWRKGGLHQWDKNACRCGHYMPSFRTLFAEAAK